MSHLSDYNRINTNLRAYSIKEVLPQYYASEYPNLISFLEGYYDYIDSDGTIDAINELYSLYDLNLILFDRIQNSICYISYLKLNSIIDHIVIL